MSVTELDLVDKGLPRRLSVLRGHPHYDSGATGLSERICILLDGEELPEVASYDVDAGEVTRNRRRNDDSLILSGGIPQIERLTGRVEVRWAKRPGAGSTPTGGAAA